MAGDDLLILCCDAIKMVLAPGFGGSIIRLDCNFDNRQLPVLRGHTGPPVDILSVASFGLVPYSNRIRGGRFTFRGRQVQIKANLPNDPSPLHGDGWLAAWGVASESEAEAELVYRHVPGEWPWAYEARQQFALDSAGLSYRLSCRNISSDPMPCGLGMHPYFPCTAATRLDTHVTHAWTIDDMVLPVEKVSATGHYDLRDRLVCGQNLDNGFGGWGGAARITDPALPFAIELSSPDAHFFQLYSPSQGGLFVAEPVSHANAAMNEPEQRWPQLGFRVLEPGEEMVLRARIAISPLSAGPA